MSSSCSVRIAPRDPENDTKTMVVHHHLLERETVRGERIAWTFRWVLSSVTFCLSAAVSWGQGHPVGLWGLGLSLAALGYNVLVSPFILRRTAPGWLRYASVSVDVVGLTTYNAVEIVFTSALIPVTSATLILYPLIIVLASLRLDRLLIGYATVLAVVTMDVLYLAAAPFFDPGVASRLPGTDALSLGHRSLYVLACGALMLFIPGTLTRLLRDQQEIFQKSRDNWELAHRDKLTGLANRLQLDESLPQALARADFEGSRLALVSFNLDRFKPVNDLYGKVAGDRVLSEVGRRLTSLLREDDLAARIGGDEFVVLVPRADRRAAEGLAARIAEALVQPIDLGRAVVRIGASAGVAVYPDDGRAPAVLLGRADQDMLQAKADRRGQNQ